MSMTFLEPTKTVQSKSQKKMFLQRSFVTKNIENDVFWSTIRYTIDVWSTILQWLTALGVPHQMASILILKRMLRN